MRTLLSSAFFLLSTTAALANRCYWMNGRPYCDSGCSIHARWWDGSREWMRYSCAPPDEVWLVAGVAILFVVAIIAAIASAATNDPHAKDIAQIAADNAKTNELTRKYEDLEQETKAHIASMLPKSRGDHHG